VGPKKLIECLGSNGTVSTVGLHRAFKKL